jgi:hypothetical protein
LVVAHRPDLAAELTARCDARIKELEDEAKRLASAASNGVAPKRFSARFKKANPYRFAALQSGQWNLRFGGSWPIANRLSVSNRSIKMAIASS